MISSQYDSDKRIFSLYIAEVMQTLEPIEVMHMNQWLYHHTPEVIGDIPSDIADMYDITIDDYRQFALQVIEFEESLAEDAEIRDWIASE